MKKLFFLLIVLITANVANGVLAQTNTYGPIKNGEVLWKIAAKVRPDDSISHYQAMLALLKANPHAFQISCNLNTLKVGQLLQIPSLTEMQAVNRAEAIKEFNRQSQEWKNFRQSGQTVVCPSTESKKKPILSRIKEALTPAITSEPVVTDSQNLSPKEERRKETESVESTFTPFSEEENVSPSIGDKILTWLLQFLAIPNLLLIIISITLIILLSFLAFFIGKLLSKLFFHQESSPQSHSVKQKFATVMEETKQSDSVEDMKNKLAQVRSYLAEDSSQIVQRILREVIQNGSSEQQAEAKQLYEITKKMNHSKQNTTKKQQITTSDKHSNWPNTKNKPWPVQQYLPENQEQLFGLIDKIFEFLDYELNAQGKLVEAYVNRHQQDFFKEPNYQYEIVDSAEKVVINGEKEKPLRKPQTETKPTRYL